MADSQELPTAAELSAAKEVIGSFLSSMKNYDLYPPEHNFSRNLLKSIHNRLNDFLVYYGSLRIDIEQKRLLYKSLPVYEEKSTDDNLAFIFYRDGLLWLEFEAGLSVEEVNVFFEILNKYKVLHDEPEDDIVTALWDKNLSHISYEAKEIFFDEVPLLDFSNLNPSKLIEKIESETDEADNSSDIEKLESIQDKLPGDGQQPWWTLSKEEFEILRGFVLDAEKSVRKGDLLQVLFFVLTNQSDVEAFEVVLDFLKAEWRSEITDGNFARTVQQLDKLRNLAMDPPMGREWIGEPIRRFIRDISGGDFLSCLEAAIARLDENESGQVDSLKNFLMLLAPEALHTIGYLAPRLDGDIGEIFSSAMVKLGMKDLEPLKDLLDNKDEKVALNAGEVLSRINNDEAVKLLSKAIDHPSPKVRRYALKKYLENEKPNIETIFRTIDDPDPATRFTLLSFLGRERNGKVERLLLNYLQRDNPALEDEHLYNCYLALGRCGSSYSLPFLKENLLESGWKAMLGGGNNTRQQGSVKALVMLRDEGAVNVLKQGAASLMPGVRKLCRNALAEIGRG